MRLLLLSVALLGLSACGGSPAEAPTQDPPPADTTITQADNALSRVQRLDEQLAYGASRVQHLTADSDQEPRVLRLWEEEGQPVKLMVTEPDDADPRREVSEYYFEDGQLFFARHPRDRYVFERGQMVSWLDDRLEPVEATEQDREAREASVQEEANRYLAAFD